ncbi:phage minor capsid protein, partial [Treponema sp.]|uniref:phage minor capsid protein n=1 Tax=Treponema sp. TaxID=166 RepID=UPI00338EFC34
MCGINCRHSFYPYFDGMKAHYGADDLDEMAGEKVRFTGSDGVEHELTRYEGEQKLRGIERKIRYYKKKALVRRSAGVDDTAARRKLGEWQAVARDFVKQTGLRRDYAREYVGVSRSLWNPMGEQPRGSKGTKEKYVKTAKDTTIQNVSDIKKDDDIVDYFVNKYNADTNNRLAFMDVDSVKAFNKG